jgi:deoxycytidylate deaminase
LERNEYLSRLVKIVSHSEIVRPSTEETAMHHAYGAACAVHAFLGVGAALVDKTGNVVATGTNEVPRAGGGVYGENFDTDHNGHTHDHRCAYRRLNGADPFAVALRNRTLYREVY